MPTPEGTPPQMPTTESISTIPSAVFIDFDPAQAVAAVWQGWDVAWEHEDLEADPYALSCFLLRSPDGWWSATALWTGGDGRVLKPWESRDPFSRRWHMARPCPRPVAPTLAGLIRQVWRQLAASQTGFNVSDSPALLAGMAGMLTRLPVEVVPIAETERMLASLGMGADSP